MGKLHEEGKSLARIALVGDFPICIATDGTIIVALQWDYAAWTARADQFAQSVHAQGKEKSSYLVCLSGDASERLHKELESRGFSVRDRLSPGPLK
jgi:hypothetical protein